jgi:AcrR family transcriptional regulator
MRWTSLQGYLVHRLRLRSGNTLEEVASARREKRPARVAPKVAKAAKTTARVRAKRNTPNKDRILEVTIELLERGGEHGFRIEDLQARTKISKSSLYLAFGSRDGLLAAAYARMFAAQVMESISGLQSVVEIARNPKDLRVSLHAATAFVAAPERHKSRLDRISILAGVRGRPEFRQYLSQAQRDLTAAITRLLEIARHRELINLRQHSPRVAAQFIQAMTLGRVIAEIEDVNDEKNRAEWVAAINDFVDRMLFDGLIDD